MQETKRPAPRGHLSELRNQGVGIGLEALHHSGECSGVVTHVAPQLSTDAGE
jgi:hypothetical protein